MKTWHRIVGSCFAGMMLEVGLLIMFPKMMLIPFVEAVNQLPYWVCLLMGTTLGIESLWLLFQLRHRWVRFPFQHKEVF